MMRMTRWEDDEVDVDKGKEVIKDTARRREKSK